MSSAAKVGAFMLVSLGILGFFVLKIEDLRDWDMGDKSVWDHIVIEEEG